VKIDIFSHIFPAKYRDAVMKVVSSNPELQQRALTFPPDVTDLDARFKYMDKFEGYVHVLTLSEPPVEAIADPERASDLAKAGNDSLAELIVKYPDRFVTAVACLPMNNMDAALKEADRTIKDLKLKGVQIYSNINGKPLDSPEFLPLYEKMEQYDLPIWIHPTRPETFSDYKTEEKSIYRIVGLYGWPYETTVAMARLVCSGILEKYPKLKFITHHCGGILPFLAGRAAELGPKRMLEKGRIAPLTKEPIEYLKMFYGDTAIYGPAAALMCGYSFFGADHMLLGTDMPLGSFSEPGIVGVKLAINGINQMDISASDKEKIFSGNARRLLHLP